MKRIFLMAAGAFFYAISSAQSTPLDFLGAVPQPPYQLCEAGIQEKMEFLDQFARFDSLLQARMEEYDAKGNDQYMEDHREEAMVNTLMKSGYSREDAVKMTDPNLSEQEKIAIANRMMVSRYNMDMDEAKKVAKLDKAAQQRWAKAQSTGMIAEAQLDPEGNQKKQIEIKGDIELQQNIKYLQDKLRAGENKFLDQIREIDVKADSAMSELRPKLEKLQKALEEGNGDSHKIIDEIVSLRQQYCEKFTPGYLKTIEGFKGYVADHLREYTDLEEMLVESMERQTGIKNPDYKPGQMAMGMVGSYRSLVGGAFKYNLNAEWGAQFVGY